MSTALIMFSVFFTGAVITHKEPNPSNTLMLAAIICILVAVGMLVQQEFFAG